MKCPRCFAVCTEDELALGICPPCRAQRAAPVPPLDVEGTFGRGGPLAGGNPNYEARPGQVRLSRAIIDALASGQHLFAEGPCGIGKSKAYGVPAAHLAASGKRVLIVTASIALQEQLVRKDLPDLQRELGWKFHVALLKGKNNYICKEEFADAVGDGLGAEDLHDFRTISKWATSTKTGDRSELTIRPSDLVWGRVSTTSDACPGKKCPSFETCFAQQSRERAANAGVVVTNYHLFFLNMATGGQILPAADVVILDEAHEATDIARGILGFRVGEFAFRKVANDAQKRGAGAVALQLREASTTFFSRVLRFHDSGHYKSLLRWAVPLDTSELETATKHYVDECAKSHLVDYALRALKSVKDAVEVKDPNCVYWISTKGEANERRASLEARYVSVAPVLERDLWPAYKSVVAVSATLTTDAKFDFVRRELGAPSAAREVIVESPFDFTRQAMLVVPPAHELPEPNDPAFLESTAQRVIETIEACGGRTLALFTSYRALNAVYDIVRRHFNRRINVYRQGELPPALLTERFKNETRSVLLATTSFWTGIDVPGESLTGLVIDRLPFGSPDDPVTIRITESDRNAFGTFTVPRSILTLRQGVGRLIRSQRDVGCVVLLDKRLMTKGYGARFLKSLPPMLRATSTAQIAPFLRSKGVAA